MRTMREYWEYTERNIENNKRNTENTEYIWENYEKYWANTNKSNGNNNFILRVRYLIARRINRGLETQARVLA